MIKNALLTTVINDILDMSDHKQFEYRDELVDDIYIIITEFYDNLTDAKVKSVLQSIKNDLLVLITNKDLMSQYIKYILIEQGNKQEMLNQVIELPEDKKNNNK